VQASDARDLCPERYHHTGPIAPACRLRLGTPQEVGHLSTHNPLISHNIPKTNHLSKQAQKHPFSNSSEEASNHTNTTPAAYQDNTNVLHQRHTMVDMVDKMHQTTSKGI
jgi:hypothetical protein